MGEAPSFVVGEKLRQLWQLDRMRSVKPVDKGGRGGKERIAEKR